MPKLYSLLLVCLLAATPAFAGLQNVQVGGEIRIKLDHIPNWSVSPGQLEVRWPAGFLPARPIGDVITGAPFNGRGVISPYEWDEDTNAVSLIEQRTRVNVHADFTDEVSAFIELESYDFWGEDFRSNYVTGADARAVTADDIEMYQGYVQTENTFGMPLRLRIGRQDLRLGSEWLVGPKDFGPFYRGRSFDALRATYAPENFSIDVFASQLFEGGVAEEDEDVWFYGAYGTVPVMDELTAEAYWLFLRDARSLNDTNFVWAVEWLENVFGLDDYDPTELHTVGGRIHGAFNGFDYNLDAAYQFGEADAVGVSFKPFIYGDDEAEFDAWAAQAELGYTADMTWNPRFAAYYAYYSGEDNRDISFWEWLNPFDEPEASVSFNRLFSNQMYNGFFDLQNDFSNGHVFRVEALAHPSEKLHLNALLSYYLVDEAFDAPRHVNVGRWRVPLAPNLSFWTEENSDEIGWTTDLVAIYNYSEDLMFIAHWCHLITGDGLAEGGFNAFNGLLFTGGDNDDDADFFSLEARLSF